MSAASGLRQPMAGSWRCAPSFRRQRCTQPHTACDARLPYAVLTLSVKLGCLRRGRL